ncbi:16S rRNA (guanine(527)-N(7))-methyltransferase RsmG [Kordiimonas aquimaris]|uniref:16S rRNA (guanine(527)-N(7))-methyltransferase RsmG n=1 Tax=Kordiimonas aquimaris TaxID=707591 RepID=UPI0021D36E59|nr:16S rRNA (guanine(527)-N(7))-methyltransferase RsmG [Kordiimonas aquimaris]
MYGPEDFVEDTNVSRETLQKLTQYADALVKWQKAKNLVANSTLEDRWRRHFLDSAQMFSHMRKRLGDRPIRMIDIGSGAGFPGLVLSIMGLGTAHMVESNGRKCVFMNQIVRTTAADAFVHNVRIEAFDAPDYDVVVSRACAKVEQLLDWSHPFRQNSTEMWLLKGEGVEDELTQAEASWKMKSERFESLSSSSGTILRLYEIEKK